MVYSPTAGWGERPAEGEYQLGMASGPAASLPRHLTTGAPRGTLLMTRELRRDTENPWRHPNPRLLRPFARPKTTWASLDQQRQGAWGWLKKKSTSSEELMLPSGGSDRRRSGDLSIFSRTLYQLSYRA
jgi:hypothetical protein